MFSKKLLVLYKPRHFRKFSEKITPVNLAYTSLDNLKSSSPAPPLIIMHGLNGSKKNFNSLSHQFHKHTQRKVISIDARNHGDSPHSPKHTYFDLTEDIAALLKTLHIQKASLMGHSMGGRTMMLSALKYPDFVEKLIVIDISPISNPAGLTVWHQCLIGMNNMSMPTGETPLREARKTVEQGLRQTVPSKEMRDFLLMNLVHKDTGYYWRSNVSVLLKHIDDIVSFPKIDSSPFQGPVLFVCGDNSEHLPAKDHGRVQEMFPNAKFEYIAGGGHWVHSSKPAEFEKVCTDFLNDK